MIDVAELKKVEEELRQSNARNRAVLESSVDGIIVTDERGIIQSLNPAAIRMSGYWADELVGRNVRILLPQPHRSQHDGYINAYGATGEGQMVGIGRKTTCRRKDGSIFPIDLAVSEMVFNGRRIFIGALRDLSARKRTEEALRFAQFSVDHASDPIFWVGREGNLFYVNQAACRTLEYSREQLLSMRFMDIAVGMPGEGWSDFRHAVKQHGTRTFRAEQVTRSGRRIATEFTVNRLELDGFEYHCLIARDISQKLAAQERIRLLREEFARASRLSTLGEITAGLAHELNQPLTAIVNYAHGCSRRLRNRAVNPADLIDIVDRIAAQAEHAGQIIRGIGTLVRRGEPHRIPIDINKIIREISGLFEPGVKSQGAESRLELADGLPMVLADKTQAQQVIMNLVRNACEAMLDNDSARSIVVIRTSSAPDDCVEVAVSDTGSGIDMSELDRLFKPFVTTKPHGMGMGLAICRSIVEAHGGRLRCSPNGAVGTVFSFSLPITKPDAPS